MDITLLIIDPNDKSFYYVKQWMLTVGSYKIDDSARNIVRELKDTTDQIAASLNRKQN